MIHKHTRKISNWSLITFHSFEKIYSFRVTNKKSSTLQTLTRYEKCEVYCKKMAINCILIPRSLDNTSKYYTPDYIG